MPTLKEYQTFVTPLNKLVKQHAKGLATRSQVDELFEKFLDEFVRPYTRAPFTLSLGLKLQVNQVCVLANSTRSERCIGLIDSKIHDDQCRDGLVYTFRKISFKTDKKESIEWEAKTKNRHCIFSEKKGFWLFLPTGDPIVSPITTSIAQHGKVLELYNKYVRGMEVAPADESLIVTRAEQFDLTYPTPEWAASVRENQEAKVSSTKPKKKRKAESTPKGPAPKKTNMSKKDYKALEIEMFGANPVDEITPYVHSVPKPAVFEPTKIQTDSILAGYLEHEKAYELAKDLFGGSKET